MSRRDRKDAELKRRGARRQPFGRVLICCEGAVTEKGYFDGLRKALRLPVQNVKILHRRHDTDPRHILADALKEYNRQDRDFDEIFIVVDHDLHPNLQDALVEARKHPMGRSGKLMLIVSNPCFEVWINLHLEGYSTAPYQSSQDAKEKTRRLLPEYDRQMNDLYPLVAGREEQALAYAERLDRHHEATGSNGNPSSGVPKVLKSLRLLAEAMRKQSE